MKLSTKDALKVRVAKIKPLLPENYKTILLGRMPMLDTVKGGVRIHNVINLKGADEEITIALEQIAKEHQAELKESGETTAA